MNRKTKAILGIALGIIIIFFGTAFALAKAGIWDMGIFASAAGTNILKIEIQNPDGTEYLNNINAEAWTADNRTLHATASSVSQIINGKKVNIVTLTGLLASTKYSVNFNVTATGCISTGEFTTGATGTTKTGIQKIGCTSGYNVRGYIKDKATGLGIPGATASLIGGPSGTVPNDDKFGNYTIEKIPFSNAADIETHRFQFSASGYDSKGPLTLKQVTGISDLNSIENNGTVGGIATYLTKTAGTVTPPSAGDTFTFSGIVRASDNSVIQNATVKVFTNRNQTNPLTQTTDENGIFSFVNYPMIYPNNDPGKASSGNLYTIQVTAQGYAPLAANKSLKDFGIVEVKKGQSYTLTPDIKLARDPNHLLVYGFVKDQDNNSLISGSVVTASFGSQSWKATSQAINITSTMPGDYNYVIDVNMPNFATKAGQMLAISTPVPTGYKSASTGHSVAIPIPRDTNLIRQDMLFVNLLSQTSFSGTVKNEAGKLIDGVKVGITWTSGGGGSNSSITQFGQFNFASAPKTKVSIKFENLQGYASVKDGNPQTVDLTNTTYKDFVLTGGATTTPTTTKIYGTVYTNKNTKPVGGLKLEFKKTDDTLITSATSENNLKEGDGITQDHNYSVDVPKMNIKVKIAVFPDGYQIYNKGPVEWTVNCTSGNVQRQNIILEQIPSDTITIVGAIKRLNPSEKWTRDNPEMFIEKADISIHTLNDDNSITTTKGKSLGLNQTVPLRSGIGNIKIENVPRSKSGKYVIDYKKNSDHYQGQRIAYNNNLINLGNNIYQIPSEVRLKQLGLADWLKYKYSNVFKILGGVLNIGQLFRMFN